ncbi:hypothetical protein TNCV_966941 [Trichonephila clavipes]|nr:hypothetical protein TNCV_966941 [Trichonephila clavipes]
MSHDYAACKRSLECLFGFGAHGKIKFLLRFRIVRAQVTSSDEETLHRDYLRLSVYRLHGAALKKRGTSSRVMYLICNSITPICSPIRIYVIKRESL